MGDVSNIRVGAVGIAYFGPAGTPLLTSADGTPDGAFADLGEISFDGFTESHAEQTANVKNMSGVVVRKLTTEQEDSIKVTFLETNPDVLEAYHGPQTDASSLIEVKKQPGLRGAWMFIIQDGDSAILITIEDGQVSATDDIVYKSDDSVNYPITVTGYPATDDNTMLKYPPESLS